jgi:DNA invertase Pin-like site-specific DNA recombinase
MKVLYSRVSSTSQQEDRQIQDIVGFDYVFTDKCSGLIPLWERPKGSQIKKMIDNGQLKQITVHSIDRLGRSTIDVLQVWKDLTEQGITIECRNPNLRNLDDTGRPDIFSELMISILSTMSKFEKEIIFDRQKEGIQVARIKGKYKGRTVQSVETKDKFLSKPRIKKVIEYLNSGYSQQEITKIMGCSYSTIQKVKMLLGHL